MKDDKKPVELISGVDFKIKIESIVEARAFIKKNRFEDKSWQEIEMAKARLAAANRSKKG